MLKKKEVWYICCSTGCTCCSYEDFDQGFYSSEEEAKGIVEKYLKGDGNPLGSQYAKYGKYYVEKAQAELLGDGRMIVNGSVYPCDYIGRLDDVE
ncbi:hypothetical protein ACSW8S_15175 (plasmid) [Clostridium perfringens]